MQIEVKKKKFDGEMCVIRLIMQDSGREGWINDCSGILFGRMTHFTIP